MRMWASWLNIVKLNKALKLKCNCCTGIVLVAALFRFYAVCIRL